MPEQIPWEKFSEALKQIAITQFPMEVGMTPAYRKVLGEKRTAFLNTIAEAMKSDLWKCYCDTKCGPDINFETWYANTYQK